MSKERLALYLKHVDSHGVEEVAEAAERDKNLTEDEKAAVRAYVDLKTPRRRKKRE